MHSISNTCIVLFYNDKGEEYVSVWFNGASSMVSPL